MAIGQAELGDYIGSEQAQQLAQQQRWGWSEERAGGENMKLNFGVG